MVSLSPLVGDLPLDQSVHTRVRKYLVTRKRGDVSLISILQLLTAKDGQMFTLSEDRAAGAVHRVQQAPPACPESVQTHSGPRGLETIFRKLHGETQLYETDSGLQVVRRTTIVFPVFPVMEHAAKDGRALTLLRAVPLDQPPHIIVSDWTIAHVACNWASWPNKLWTIHAAKDGQALTSVWAEPLDQPPHINVVDQTLVHDATRPLGPINSGLSMPQEMVKPSPW